MKTNKLLATLFLMLVFIIKITAQVPAYVPTNGLVGWWPFTGNPQDLSGNGNNGTNNGATLTTDRFGNPNSAYSFNGVTNQIIIPNNALFNFQSANAASFSFWIKPNSISGGVSTLVLNKQTGVACAQVGWNMYIYNTSGNKMQFRAGNGTCSNVVDIPSVSNIITGISTHVVNVINNGVAYQYINGVFNATLACPQAIIGDNTGAFIIAGLFPGASGCALFNGVIDDIGIWNRALNQAEVTALYNAVSCVAPIASITTQGNSTFCAGGSCTLNANAGNSYTYQWYNNGTLINGATAITFTASQAGNYTVKVTDGLTSCFTTSQPQSVIVNPQPNVSFGLPISSCWVPGCVIYRQINASTIPLNGTPNGGTYQGPGISGSAFSPTVAGLGNKNLKYTYTDNNGCSNFANQSVIIYDTIICPTVSGIIKNSEDLLNEESVKIYPNPNQGFFNLELTECKNSIIKITDVLGKTILNQKAELFNEIDLKNQSSGVYTINIITDKKIKYSTKVIKE